VKTKTSVDHKLRAIRYLVKTKQQTGKRGMLVRCNSRPKQTITEWFSTVICTIIIFLFDPEIHFDLSKFRKRGYYKLKKIITCVSALQIELSKASYRGGIPDQLFRESHPWSLLSVFNATLFAFCTSQCKCKCRRHHVCLLAVLGWVSGQNFVTSADVKRLYTFDWLIDLA
jgi:hypothetical protein